MFASWFEEDMAAHVARISIRTAAKKYSEERSQFLKRGLEILLAQCVLAIWLASSQAGRFYSQRSPRGHFEA